MNACGLRVALAVLCFALPAFAEDGARAGTTPAHASSARARSPLNEGEPKPYFAPPERERRFELLDLGADVGLAIRPSGVDSIHYAPGPSYGVHARVEVLPWLGARAIVTRSNIPVTIAPGALLAGTRADQPSLDVLELGGRVEPTWLVNPRTRLWFGLGAAWNRIRAEEPALSGRPVQGARRSGVGVEYMAALGGTFDVIPKWLAVSASLSASALGAQSGNVFEPLQAIDESIARPNDPLVHIAGLPKFEAAYSALLGIGLLL